MSSYSVGNNVLAFHISELFCFIKAQYSIPSSAVTTVSNDDRLFVSAEFTSMLLDARGVDSGVSPCYCCVCWPRGRVVR